MGLEAFALIFPLVEAQPELRKQLEPSMADAGGQEENLSATSPAWTVHPLQHPPLSPVPSYGQGQPWQC